MELPRKDPVTYTTYHNHTKWSDGSGTVAEMIEAAQKAGFTELGISDHFALAPGNPKFRWALPTESLDDYVAQIRQAMASSNGIILRLGLEVDYFPKSVERIKDRLAAHRFDFLIGSVHFVDDFAIDLNAQPWEGLSQDSRDSVWRSYWRLLRETAQSGLFDIIGHFDLPKKFKFHPSIDLTEDALAALDAVAAADMAIEINTSGWDRPVGEAYPSMFYLREARRRNIPLVINSDAHAPGEIARHFDRAWQLAAAAGYTELVRFEQRQRFSYPL
jgi:histidinol-phosphatase (PHP family)